MGVGTPCDQDSRRGPDTNYTIQVYTISYHTIQYITQHTTIPYDTIQYNTTHHTIYHTIQSDHHSIQQYNIMHRTTILYRTIPHHHTIQSHHHTIEYNPITHTKAHSTIPYNTTPTIYRTIPNNTTPYHSLPYQTYHALPNYTIT